MRRVVGGMGEEGQVGGALGAETFFGVDYKNLSDLRPEGA